MNYKVSMVLAVMTLEAHAITIATMIHLAAVAVFLYRYQCQAQGHYHFQVITVTIIVAVQATTQATIQTMAAVAQGMCLTRVLIPTFVVVGQCAVGRLA
jgi:hypothetical protein